MSGDMRKRARSLGFSDRCIEALEAEASHRGLEVGTIRSLDSQPASDLRGHGALSTTVTLVYRSGSWRP